VEFYLYIRTSEDADAAAAALRAEGYATRVAPSAAPESDRPWLVLASREGVAIDAAEPLFRKLAEQYDGEYDGWGAAVG
jgi:hypothetical protein